MAGGKVEVLMRKVFELRNALASAFVQREGEIAAVLAGLLSGEPVLLVGPYGTAKTAIVERLARLCGCRYFYRLLNRFTDPDELLGPVDTIAYRERGEYRRIIEGYLPTHEIIFLDEIFKASSAIRNILLDIILNKRIINGTQMMKIPMLALYTASNEISTDEEDAPFYDRLTIRKWLNYVDPSAWGELIDAGLDLLAEQLAGGSPQPCAPILTADEIRRLQRETIKRAIAFKNDAALKSKYLEALAELRSKGIVVSDRRKIKIIVVAAAVSILYGEPKITPDDLAEAIRFCAPSEEEHLAKIEEVIEKCKLTMFSEDIRKLESVVAELENINKQLREVLANIRQSGQLALPADLLRASAEVRKNAAALLRRMPKSPRLLPYVRRLRKAAEENGAIVDEIKKMLEGLGL